MMKQRAMSGEALKRDLFLSYNTFDRDAVLKVRLTLRLGNVATFFDKADLTPGQSWFDELEAALRQVRAVAIFIGKNGLGTVQKREMQFALARQVEEERAERRFPVVPVLLEGAEPDRISGFLALNTWVDLRGGFEDSPALDPLFRVLGQPVSSERAEPSAPICPYRSLNAFREEDAGLFFGRDAFSRKLLIHVRNNNVVAVIGPSGSGKSSIVQAGLLPLLRRQKPPEETWASLVFTPGARPFHRLAGQLVRLWSPPERDLTDIGTESDKLGDRLASGEASLAGFIDLALQSLPDTGRLLAVIDQFEELFTQTSDRKQQERFGDQVLRATRESKLTVVLTLRADFYGRAIGLRDFADCLETGIVNMREMSREEWKQAIQMPAVRTGMEFEAGLADRILDHVERQPGSLPLLEYALTALWQRREGGRLTHAAYDAIGGVEGAIAKRADEQFKKLRPAQRDVAMPAFSRLVRVAAANEESADARQIVPLGSFTEEAQTVLRLFAGKDVRLVVTDRDEAGNRETVTVAHEALIRGWDKLRDWIDRDREFLLWRQQLQLFLRKWKSLDQGGDSALLSGIYLDEARRWSRERGRDLSPDEARFIGLSEGPVSKSRRQKLIWAFAAILIAIGAVGFGQTRFFRALDLPLRDMNFVVRGSRPVRRVVMVVVEPRNAGLGLMTEQNFPRSYYAEAIRAAGESGARVIGLDVAARSPQSVDPDGDRAIVEAVSASPVPVICLCQAPTLQPPPLEVIASALGTCSFEGLTQDDDSVIRKAALIDSSALGGERRGFALRVAEKYLGADATIGRGELWLKGRHVPRSNGRDLDINFAGSSGSSPSISLQNFLIAYRERKKEVLGQVRGKAVLVGYPDVYGDYPINLFDLTRRSIPEIQANAVNTLIEGDYLTPVPVWARGALWFILMSITIAIIVKRRVSQAIAWSVVEFAAIPIAAYGLFRFGWILSCAQLILVFIVALLAGISWRNARSAQRLRVTSHSSYDPRISRRFPA